MKSLYTKKLFILLLLVVFGWGAAKNFSAKSLQNNKAEVLPAKVTPTTRPRLSPTPAGFCLNVPVLFYHHVEALAKAESEGHKSEAVAPEVFDSQMRYLVSKGYRTINAEELVKAIYAHQSLGKVAVITLDDGYDDAYFNAFQTAKKYGITLNLMISPGLLGNAGFLSWSELQEMSKSGMGVYDHTWSHFSLNLGDDSKVTYEIMQAKRQLDENLGTNQTILTYPYGGYNKKVIDILSANGFKAAFTTLPGRYQCEANVMTLPRIRIGNAPLSAYGL